MILYVLIKPRAIVVMLSLLSGVAQAPVPLVAERQPKVVVEGHHTLTLKVNKLKSKYTADLNLKG